MAARYLAPLARSFTRPFAAQRSLSAAGYRQLVQDVTKNLQVHCSRPRHCLRLPKLWPLHMPAHLLWRVGKPPLVFLFVMCGFTPEQPSFAEEGAFEKLPLPLRDYSGNNPDFYFNSSVEEATVAQRNASRFLPAPSTASPRFPLCPAHPGTPWRTKCLVPSTNSHCGLLASH